MQSCSSKPVFSVWVRVNSDKMKNYGEFVSVAEGILNTVDLVKETATVLLVPRVNDVIGQLLFPWEIFCKHGCEKTACTLSLNLKIICLAAL